MIPLRDENPSKTVPVVTIALVAINALAFFYELAIGRDLRAFVFDWGMVPARLTLALRGADESLTASATTFVTSMFLHGGWLHLIGNMWYLWIFGDNIEDRLGRFRFLWFYLLAGVLASLAHYASNPGSQIPTVGASGAIAAVLGAYMVLFPRARVMTLIPLFPFIQVVALPAIVVLGLWFVFQALSGFLSLGAAGGGVAWWAHIGGFAFGVVAIKLLTPRRRRVSKAWVE